MALYPNELHGHRFADYILKTYVEPNSLFPPVLWAKEPSRHPRTTNSTESFHRTFNWQFYSTHPPVYAVIKTLLEIQEETALKLNDIQQGTIQKPSKIEQEKISKTIISCNKYCQNKSSEELIKSNAGITLTFAPLTVDGRSNVGILQLLNHWPRTTTVQRDLIKAGGVRLSTKRKSV
ncbi:uncharacterized protein LOC112602802 [Melanaphis sacchari]|uniref:uncharacterized protein LOC112602802 n=1 Tax=Melanaphis sacchari TaxID=742174 RepID=UPI000DC13073|nr:uncharacterized protein LOC112602802 [Melanaphis sacchari]